MQLSPPRPRVAIRGSWLAVSLALLAQTGCTMLSIPSERHGGGPTSGGLPPSQLPVGGEFSCAPRAAAGAASELPWPRFHPLPTQPLIAPGDPGWP